MKKNIFITGGSGYIGSLLILKFVKDQNVDKIIFLDRKYPPLSIKEIQNKNKDKIIFIKKDMSDNTWQKEVSSYNPDIVIHCAWQIRSFFRGEKRQWLENILGSDNVFNFSFNTQSVKKLIHFSTVASYGAFKENDFSQIFDENMPLRNSDFRYAYEKKEAEDRLYAKYCMEKNMRPDLKIFVVRPASIAGPFGRGFGKIGLQSILSGRTNNFLHKWIHKILFFAPLTKKWARQFIHESDVVDIVNTLSFLEDNTNISNYEIFNLCPPGEPMKAHDMAKYINKKLLYINPNIVRFLFLIFWYGTRGIVPTSKGAWKSYCYPIIVDGSKITKICNFNYKYGPQESFIKD